MSRVHTTGFTLFAATAIMASLLYVNACASENGKKTIQENKHGFMRPLADAELDKNRGAFLPSMFNLTNNTVNINNNNTANLNASSSGNVVIGGVTGSNYITSSSFSGASGLVNVIQNTGNNVLIQSSTIVNTTFNSGSR